MRPAPTDQLSDVVDALLWSKARYRLVIIDAHERTAQSLVATPRLVDHAVLLIPASMSPQGAREMVGWARGPYTPQATGLLTAVRRTGERMPRLTDPDLRRLPYDPKVKLDNKGSGPNNNALGPETRGALLDLTGRILTSQTKTGPRAGQ